MDKDSANLNIKFGWAWLLIGILQAAFIGLFAFQTDWLGGYDSLARRLVRLSHIAFMALSIVNIIYGLCLLKLTLSDTFKKIGSYSMILAAITMPLVCLLSAYKFFFHNFFFIPVICFLTAVVIMVAAQLKERKSR